VLHRPRPRSSQDYDVKVHAEGKLLHLRESLRNLETRPDPRRFSCVHRSTIVNVACVRQLGAQDPRRIRASPG